MISRKAYHSHNAEAKIEANSLNCSSFDLERIRQDFPILRRQVNGQPLTYLDSAATSLKPKSVIEAIVRFYTESCANIHRGVHLLSTEASELFEESRRKIAGFLNADEEEVVLVRNATEAINLVCHSLELKGAVGSTLADHHSSALPWLDCFEVRYVELESDGALSMSSYKKAIRSGAALVCVPYISNALSVISPIKELIDAAHEAGALVLVDGSQSVSTL